MVKPSKTMEPEAFDLDKAGRGAGKAFQQDSFREYMARKMHLQRKQFGEAELPPEPSENRKRKKLTVSYALQKLKSKYGSPKRLSQVSKEEREDDPIACDEKEPSKQMKLSTPPKMKRKRKDLFFMGICVQVNGFTNPDADTLQRLLHQHGGNLEKYESSRVTHIIAEQLSTAKANIYKKQRKPTPVVYPKWIVDCVEQEKLLPHGDYLIKEVRQEREMPNISGFFRKPKDAPGKEEEVVEDKVSDFENEKAPFEEEEVVHDLDDSEIPATQSSVDAIDLLKSQGQQNGLNGGSEHEKSGSDEEDEPSNAKAQEQSIQNVTEKKEEVKGRSVNTSRHINGQIRTVGNDPDFLESFFSASRLSFIGSYRQRVKASPTRKARTANAKQHKFVYHIDMDCFFASVALRKYPHLQDKPVVISHLGKSKVERNEYTDSYSMKNSTSECATCNYEARKYGIKKGMYIGRAKSLCPDLIVLQYDFEGYEEVSEKVVEIVNRYIDDYGGCIEQVSCDECYAELYYEAANDKEVMVLAAKVAEGIRTDIHRETMCTATIGVSSNKLLSKLATDKVKPNRSYVVDDYRELLQPLELRQLHGIGYRSERKLEEEGLKFIQDVWDLGDRGESELCRVLGKGTGSKIYNYCYGRDDRKVEAAERQSIGAECNYGVRFNGPYGVDYMMDGLAREVAKRMQMVGVRGMKVTLKVKQRKENAPPPPKFLGHGKCHNLSRSADVPGTIATRDPGLFAKIGNALFEQLKVDKDDVRGMGLTITKLVDDKQSERGETGLLKWVQDKKKVIEPCDHEEINKSERADVPTLVDTVNDMSELENETKASNDKVESPIPYGQPEEKENEAEDLVVLENSNIAEDQEIDEVEDFDLMVPSASQIHMSQVDALPSPMRKQIIEKLNAKKSPPRPAETKKAGMRQLDVKRMMRHAAVMSGQVELENVNGEKYSLDYLRSLPYDIQVQIANGEEVSFPRKKRRVTFKPTVAKVDRLVENETFIIDDVPSVSKSKIEETDPDPYEETAVTPTSFYEENVSPLMVFMDESKPDEKSINYVTHFFEELAEEGRSKDIVVLLRAVENRKDTWNADAFTRLVHEVNDCLVRHQSYALDLEALFPCIDVYEAR